jgi:hypothetical protein
MQASFWKIKDLFILPKHLSQNRVGFIYLEVVDLKISVKLVRDEKEV